MYMSSASGVREVVTSLTTFKSAVNLYGMAGAVFNVLSILLLMAGAAHARVLVVQVEGFVNVNLSGSNDWHPLKGLPYVLKVRDEVRLAPSSHARIELDDGATLQASKGARIVIVEDSEKRMAARLESGSVIADSGRSQGRRLEFKTPAGVCGFVQGNIMLDLNPTRTMVVEVRKGSARIVPEKGEIVEMQQGFHLDVPSDRAPGAARKFKTEVIAHEPKLGPESLGLKVTEGIAPTPLPSVVRKKRESGASEINAAAADISPDIFVPSPELGPKSLGLQPSEKPLGEEELGPQTLGLRDPEPEKIRPIKSARKVGAIQPPSSGTSDGKGSSE